jgi:diguanylate cyclase (GGDEF)-like protein
VIKGKDYSSENFHTIVRRQQEILNAPWKNDLKMALEEAIGRVHDFKHLLQQRTEDVRELEAETIRSVESEGSFENLIDDVKIGFGGLITQMEEDARNLVEMSMTDTLTKLGNRRSFDVSLGTWFKKCQEEQRPLSLLMIDIDFFKRFNDDYGHRIGDQALATVASVINGSNPGGGRDHEKYFLPARFGGEEFVVLLVGYRNKEVMALAEEVRKRVAGYNFVIRDIDGAIIKNGIQITISVGVARCLPEWKTPDRIIEAADQALYTSKRSGRNCVSVFSY